jgi:hypothetical protein
MSTSNKRSDQIAADQAMIAGIQKFLAQNAQLTVGSQTMTPAAIIQVYQNRISTNQAAQTADASRIAAVQANKAERASTAAITGSVRQMVLAMYSQSPDTLAVFLLKPRKASVRTPAEKALAAARAKATREARGTKGSKQKASIKGTVSSVTIGSLDPAPATPAEPTAPALVTAPAVIKPTTA